MKNYIKGMLMAFGMFSIIPTPKHEWDDNGAKHILVFYPLIGGVIGALWYGIFKITEQLNIPYLISATFVTVFPFIITGFLHLDGFMDVCDAILSRRNREEKLRILKDSTVGAFAVIALLILFILNFASITTAFKDHKITAYLIFIPIFARSIMSLNMIYLPTLKQSSLMAYFKKDVGKGDRIILIFTLAITIIGAVVLFKLKALISIIFIIVSMQVCVLNSLRHLGGMCGDIAGYGLVIAESAGVLMLGVL